MKRLLASVATTALALGGLLVATAAPASAHTPQSWADCEALHVSLKAYAPGNQLTITVDGEVLEPRTFDRQFVDSFELDPTKGHSWSVEVKASDGSQHDYENSGTTTACETDEDVVQVGVYVYPKLDPTSGAAWENSGPQKIVTNAEIQRPEWGSKEWVVEPLDMDDVIEVARSIDPKIDAADLCTAWGVQQDLVDLPGGLTDLPTDIQYSRDGNHLNPFPDNTLLDWVHQDLSTLVDETACAPGDDEDDRTPTSATPVAPAPTEVCGADVSTVALPDATAQFTYTRVEEGILVQPADDSVVFSEQTSALGYVLSQDKSRALFPLAELVPTAEECALVPGAIEAVCQGDVPYLGYEVALPEGITVDEENPLTITFLHPNGGENYVVEGQPLDGTILWPGASAQEPKQWPGFVRNEDGSYSETEGNYAWTRDGVEVLFEVNPSYSTVVSYPPATSTCANPPVAPVAVENVAGPAEPDGPALATTGATVAGAAAFAALLVGGGALVFWLRRRVQS